jgi:PAS domain S-box-containing protein
LEKKTHILVVDDEMGIREGCKRILSEEGYIVDEADEGNVGFQKVTEGSYDLILVDLMMPGIGGLDLIQKVHDIEPEIIMIVITGFATIETAVEATKLGAYDYLPKPFTPEALIAIVKRGLEKRALRLEAMKLYKERDQRLLELTNEQSRIQTIIGCMADGVLVTNMEDQLVLWNVSAVKMLKLMGTDITGKPLQHYIKNKAIIESLQEILLSKDTSFSMVSQEIHVDDQGTVLMANIASVRDEKGKILGAVTVFRDITELKEIDKIKSQFVSMVAHELRAPLAAIEGWLEVVISGEAGGDEKQNEKWLIRARERAHSLLALVNDLLEINRMEAGKVAQKMETVQLVDIIQQILEFLKPEAEKRKITIELKITENIPSIQADRRDMEKLFTNLISNAIKYNLEKGSIVVEGSVDEDYVYFRVKDTGVGISQENLLHIFEDFFRVDDEKIKNITGTGLGLTIAKKIVDSHFGRIAAESQPGRGSTFSVYLPQERKKNQRRKV